MAWRRGFAGVGVTATTLGGAAFYYRPDPSEEKLLDNQTTFSRMIKSSKNVVDDASKPDPLLLRGARCVVLASVTAVSQFVMFVLNRTTIVRDERHAKLTRLIKDRPDGVPLLTVANHASTLDDPGLVAAMMPWELVLRPDRIRWSICSQEICFENAPLAAFFGAGKVLPIARGGTLDQKLLLDFSRKLAGGRWCHVFPEGSTVQTGTLGGGQRSPGARAVGRLKWGAGKSIAHAPHTPRIIPFFHTGMQNMVAEDPATKDVLPTQPRFFNEITVRVGDEIDVSDLLSKHEDTYGPLWKYSASAAQGEDDERRWTSSSPQERKLYSDITGRIETALLALENEAREELGEEYPTIPKVVASGEYRALLSKK